MVDDRGREQVQRMVSGQGLLLMLKVSGLVLALAVVTGGGAAAEIPGPGDVAPDWTLRDAGDNAVSFREDAGDGMAVLLFWATWCPYCRTLMPHLQTLAEDFPEVRFYALNVWEDGDPEAHMERHGFTFRLLLEAEAVAARYGVKGTPGVFLVNAQNRIVYRRRSGESDVQVEAAIRRALQERGAAR